MQIEVFKIIPTSRKDTQIAEGHFIEISDEELIRVGKRFLELISESRPKGKWVDYKCSNCKEFALQWGDESMAESDFCPHCGADMRGEE